jgi:hypothetical protein
MAKPTKNGALAAWRDAENKYRRNLNRLDDDHVGKLDKAAAVMIIKARV